PGGDVFVSLLLFMRAHAFQCRDGRIAELREHTFGIPDIGHATGHAGSEVTAGSTQDNNSAACHVFAAVIAYAFYDSHRAGVAHRKAFACDAVEIGLAFQCAIKHGVAGNDLLRAEAAEVVRRAHNDATTGQAFADVVVAFANQIQCDAACQEGRKALSGCAIALDVDG